MTQTLSEEQTEIVFETLDSNFGPPDIWHIVCLECFPEFRPGTKALCGTALRGLTGRDKDDRCEPCAKIADGVGCPVHQKNFW